VEHTIALLEGGLRFVHAPMPGTGSVSIAVFMGVGSRYENDSVAGISHLVEHMLFKGTEQRPKPGAIAAAIDGVGGLQNASTDKENTVYWVKMAAEHAELGVELLSDMIRRSLLRPRDLTTEKSVILEELSMAADDPQDWIHVLTDEVLWPDQPLGREIAGTEASVVSLTRSAVRRHLATYYGPNNAVVSVAGGIDSNAARTLVERYLSDWPQVIAPAPPAASVPPVGEMWRGMERPTEQVNLCLAFPAVARRHPDRWAIDVMLTVLGGGGSSRLFQSLRERAGLAYETHAYSIHYVDTGAIVLYIGTDPTKVDRAVDGMVRELDRMRRRGITADELERAKRYYAGRLWLGMEDSSNVASWFGGQEILHHEVVTPAGAIAAIRAVTLEDVRRVARTYLRPESARLAAVGPRVDPALLERVA
jgi:predicted Zn-dependent peptidase